MRKIMLTAVIAGFAGLSAGVWLKSNMMATAAAMPVQVATISPEEITRNLPGSLPVAEVVDHM
jgi:hypothetical protein